MNRLGLLLVSVVAGAVLAVAFVFTVSALVNSGDSQQVTQASYNYGSH